jgi:hypothetical protein
MRVRTALQRVSSEIGQNDFHCHPFKAFEQAFPKSV